VGARAGAGAETEAGVSHGARVVRRWWPSLGADGHVGQVKKVNVSTRAYTWSFEIAILPLLFLHFKYCSNFLEIHKYLSLSLSIPNTIETKLLSLFGMEFFFICLPTTLW
jgi:hypothetical protein